MKIAIVSRIIYPYNIGGSGRYVTFLANHMADKGIQVDVICPTLPKPEFQFNVKFKIIELPWIKSLPFVPAYYFFIKNAADYIFKHNYDAVYWTGWAVWGFGGNSDIPLVANPYGLEPFKSGFSPGKIFSFIMNFVMKREFAHINRVISEGGKITDEIVRYLDVDRARITEIPDGVDLDYIERMKRSDIEEITMPAKNTFLYAGRIEKNKGVDYLLEAFNMISGKYDLELLIAGDGTLKKKLENGNKNNKIRFLGKVSDEVLFHLYDNTDLFVFPTLYEGLPIVVLEAMACGLPVISTDVGGVPAAVNEQVGFLIPPKDVNALTDAMIKFLELPEIKKQELGKNAYNLVKEKFTWPMIAEKTIKVCKEVIKEMNLKSHRSSRL